MGVSPSNAVPHFRLQADVDDHRLVFDLGPGIHRVGSRRNSDVLLPFAGVSREHAVLTVTPEGLTVEDRGSKNGITIDATPVTRAAVPDGSTLVFGSVPLSVQRIDAGDELAVRLAPRRPDPAFAPSETVTWDAILVAEDATSTTRRELVFPPDYRPGESPPLRALYHEMTSLAAGDLSVLIHGETGVGKEVVARILHASSRRARRPFVAINCAAIPVDLLEAEMFGVVQGAATGVKPRPGLFQEAHGGTLFLDEVGEMPRSLQPKLLRALQEREIRPLGGKQQTVDVRILAATNATLDLSGQPLRPDQGATGGLREDLYYRLAGAVLTVPPLRRCREDIPALVAHFLERIAAREGVHPRGMTRGALERLRAYPWPGNVRQLEQELHRLVLASGDGGILEEAALVEAVRTPTPGVALPPAEMDSLELAPRLEALERAMLREAMLRTGGRLMAAARLLGLSRNGLAKKLERFDLRHSWARDKEVGR
jgi:DNA-binding NtrC family response regulator